MADRRRLLRGIGFLLARVNKSGHVGARARARETGRERAPPRAEIRIVRAIKSLAVDALGMG